MNRMLLVILLVILSLPVMATDDKKIVAASLRSAIVYRSGAELTHTAKTFLEQGNNELIIEGISNRIELNSLQIGSNTALTILSVEFSTDFLRPVTKSAVIRRLEDSLESVDQELTRIQTILKTDQELLELLKSNKTIGGTQSGLSVAELTKMVEYYKTKTLELQTEISLYRAREAKTLAQHARISQQIKEEEQKNSKSGGKLLLQLYSPVSGQVDLTVSYLTPTAHWTPAYDLRVENINKPITLSYKARLAQSTGIDWKQVKLSLSSSIPSQRSNAPELKTWFLVFQESEYKLKIRGVSSIPSSANLSEVVVVGYGSRSDGGGETERTQAPDRYIVNGKEISFSEYRKIEKRAIKNIERNGNIVNVTLREDLGDYISIKDNQLNVVFDIDLPYDVPSNGKEQNVVLKDFSMPANYNYFTAPHIERDAYLLGELPDWESLNLLPGEANIIFEGTFIGKTQIDPNSTSDTLHLTLGRDKRVVVTREKLEDFSSVKFLGSNKKQTFTYEITVKNNKKEKIRMVLKDQYPLSTNKDIEVELLQHDGASVNEETGILTWKPELAPGEVKKFRVSYSVKFPKDKQVNL